MKAFLAVILSFLLFTQTVHAVPATELTEYEEAQSIQEDLEPIQEDIEAIQEELELIQEEVSDDQASTEDPEERESGPEVNAPSAVLMEASTGEVIFNKNGDEKLPPASVTKVMTLLLIFDALKEGNITLEEEVTVSEFAASMGGSQIFLEPGETQTVEVMIKSIAIASANDASVAMAEHIFGSEEEFVNQMNRRAEELGMNNTYFVNSNGLDDDSHLTTAHDIAIMSRELITKHPEVSDYAMIWMETITHETRRGTSEFGLSNTNKLVRQYPHTTGLKTGSTSKAKYCISATAERDGVELIAVIMAAPDPKARLADSMTLLNYGFGKVQVFKDEEGETLEPLRVQNGIKDMVNVEYKESFSYLSMSGEDLSQIERELVLEENVMAPIEAGSTVGRLVYTLNGKEIGSVDVIATEDVRKARYRDYFGRALRRYLL